MYLIVLYHMVLYRVISLYRYCPVSYRILSYCIKSYDIYCFDLSSEETQIKPYQQNLYGLTHVKYTKFTGQTLQRMATSRLQKRRLINFTSFVQIIFLKARIFSADIFSFIFCMQIIFLPRREPLVEKVMVCP